MVKVTHIHHRSEHHAQNSGYGRISDYMETEVIYGNSGFPYRLAKWIGGFHDQKKGIYNTHSFLKEWKLFREMDFSNQVPQVVHYLNAERDIRHIVNNKNYFSNTSFCGTFHKPPDVLKRVIPDSSILRKLDGAIAVGANQVEFLKDWLQLENVTFIPHGVDTSYFAPGETTVKQKRIVFVGQHLRDFKTFNASVKVLANTYPDIGFDVVINKPYVKYIDPNDAISVHCGLNDERLLKIYQQATLMFLPLLEVTACNSILEAMSCGLPIITSDVGSNAAYLSGTSNVLVPEGDVDACVSAIRDLLNEEDRIQRIGGSSREKAQEYDWNMVSGQVLEFYKDLTVSTQK